ncbi:MAG TPA: hypothetical protein VLC48_05975 [Gemmatimonadota bacterium]|nr:hypothetical protein [Gemmatimonadota bacterium]
MNLKPRPKTLRSQAGFTIAEMMIYLILALIVVTSICQLLISQNRFYQKQAGLQDVRNSLRAAANFLAFELRQTSASGGDIYDMSSSGITIRSVRGVGIVCGVHGSAPRFGLYSTRGTISASSEDSAMVYATSSGEWTISQIKDTWTTGGGVDTCDWPGSVASDITLEVDTATSDGVSVGAPIRAFKRVEYGMYQDDNRWWLGRKVGSASSYDKLIGPLLSPTDSGLYLVYHDQAGNVTSDSSQVAYVDIILRGESQEKVPGAGGPEYQADTLTLRVALRG